MPEALPEGLPETGRPRGAYGLRAALAVLGGVLLMALMGMTVTDVIGRYIFNAPLRGATELTELLLAAVVFLGLPAVALADEHVTVDLVTDRMPVAIKPWRGAATGLFSAVVLAVVLVVVQITWAVAVVLVATEREPDLPQLQQATL